MGKKSGNDQGTQTQEQKIPAWVEGAGRRNLGMANFLTGGILGGYGVPEPGSYYPESGGGMPGMPGGYAGGQFPGGGYTPTMDNAPGGGGSYDPSLRPTTLVAGMGQGEGMVYDALKERFGNNTGVGSGYNTQMQNIVNQGDRGMGAASMNATGMDAATVGDVANSMFGSGASFMPQYQNPYQDQVVNATMNQLNEGFARNLNAINQSQDAGVFGGSGTQLAQAQALDDFGRTAASTLAGLNQQGFNTAAQLGQSDASRFQQNNQFNTGFDQNRAMQNAGYAQQAGQFNANAANMANQFNAANQQSANAANLQAGMNQDQMRLGALNTMFNQDLANQQYMDNIFGRDAGLLSGFGALERGINQEQIMEPFKALQLRQAALGATPYPQSTTTTGPVANNSKQSKGSMIGGLGTAAAAAGPMISDENIKENKEPVTVLDKLSEIRIEQWNYNPLMGLGTATHIGPYAQEIHAQFGIGDGRAIPLQDMLGLTLKAVQELSEKVDALQRGADQ